MKLTQCQKNFTKVYPIYTASGLTWLIATVIALALAIAMSFYLDDVPLVGIIIGYIATAGLMGLGIHGACYVMYKRYQTVKTVYRFVDNIAYLIDKKLPAYEATRAKFFINDLVETEVIKMIADCLWFYLSKDVNVDMIKPYVKATFKPIGDVTYYQFGNKTKEKKAYGKAYGHLLEFEWLGDTATQTKLFCHELAHLFIGEVNQNWNEKQHHEIMKESGVLELNVWEKKEG